jgi:hypothetical protein
LSSQNFRQCKSTATQNYSPLAAVSRLADLPISRFADKIRLGRNFALPLSRLSSCASFFKSVSKKTKPAKAGWEKLEGASPDAPDFSAVREHCPPENLLFAIRYSPLAASKGMGCEICQRL